MDMLDYHKLQVSIYLDTIYKQGVQDGRRQVSQTKAVIAERYDNKIAGLEAQVLELRRKIERLQSGREASG